MSSGQDRNQRNTKAKKGLVNPPLPANPGPTTFFLKTEKEIESSAQRGRKSSRASTAAGPATQTANMAGMAGDDTFGVQSLEETIRSAISPESSLSRTNSNTTESMYDASTPTGEVSSRKRRAGNPVHPKIMATGQRIISSERLPTQASSGASPSPLRSSESPLRAHHLRRGSNASFINMSLPVTPSKLSPHPATPSTPRSGSPKSFRLSDEEGSVADESSNHATLSSNGEDDDGSVERTPQLVMPSLAMPARRPFTEQGKRIGRANIMIVGPKGVGKTSFIHSLFRCTEHIVHVDDDSDSVQSQSRVANQESGYRPTSEIRELLASTRPYPSWWTDFESRRMLHKPKSVGTGVMDRNLTFIDTPGLGDDCDVKRITDRVTASLRRTADLETMSDHELVGLLSGEGGAQLDAVIYLFEPTTHSENDVPYLGLSAAQQELLQRLCEMTNVIPLIGKADTVDPESLQVRKQRILQLFDDLKARPYRLLDDAGELRFWPSDGSFSMSTPLSGTSRSVAPTPSPSLSSSSSERDPASQRSASEPLAVSSTLGDDSDMIDASVLMSSRYMQPLIPSELALVIDTLFVPANIAKLKHQSAIKFLLWRQENLGYHIDMRKQAFLLSPQLGTQSAETTTASSMHEDHSQVLVPQGSSSYYRSLSPSASDASAFNPATARYNEQSQPSEPFRQVRLAKWAQDLQRSLQNERQKYTPLSHLRPSEWTSDSDSEKQLENALVPTKDAQRPARGRLGGDLAVIDPRDPLGLLAFGQTFGRRGFAVLKIAGGFGLLGAVAYWVVRNWADVQDFLGIGEMTGMASVAATPAPERGWLDEMGFKSLLVES